MCSNRVEGILSLCRKGLECGKARALALLTICRPHKTLANPYPRTPAMAAGIENHIWTIEEIVELMNKSPKIDTKGY